MAQPRPSRMIVLAALALLAAGLACSAVSSLTGERATATPQPTTPPVEDPTEEVVGEPTEAVSEEPTDGVVEEPTEAPTEEVVESPTLTFEDTPAAPAGTVLFEDNFDEDVNGWDVDGDDTSAREFRDGAYSIQVFNTVWFAWANPETEAFNNIHLQVTVSNAGGNDPAFGVLCSYLNPDAFYFLGFGDDGFYGIARVEGSEFNLLTGDGSSWSQSDDIELFQDSYVLEADCHDDGRLRLTVDGVLIAEAQDTVLYGAGSIGLFVQSFDNVPVDVVFDDLVVTQIEE